MDDPDYTYLFNAIENDFSFVERHNHRDGSTLSFQVAIKDQRLPYWSFNEALPQVADLADLALAIHIAGRFIHNASERPARIHLRLPVRSPEVFTSAPLLQALQDVLYWYTENRWDFAFEKRTVTRRAAERQATFYCTDVARTEVALWSGGLDSFAGLWQRQLHHPERHYVLCGTGANALILGRQHELVKRLREVSSMEVSLIQVPLRLHLPHRTPPDRYQRTRGFVFLVLGAVCAYLHGQSTLHIYENGVGAMNLPLRPAEVGTDHSRAVHPLSLLKMGDVVSHVFGSDFRFINPFLFWTKAELCSPLRDTPAEPLIQRTISCDARPRTPNQPLQCGRCSSCLLRRQALAVTGIADQPYAHQASRENRYALTFMLAQRDTLSTCFTSHDPWKALRQQYPEVVKTVTRMAKATGIPSEQLATSLIGLYRRYTGEWDRVQHLLDIDTPYALR